MIRRNSADTRAAGPAYHHETFGEKTIDIKTLTSAFGAARFIGIAALALGLGATACSKSDDSGDGNPDVVGTFTGTLEHGNDTEDGYVVRVVNDMDNNPTLMMWDFCNIAMVGEHPTYEAADGARCKVETDDGSDTLDATATLSYDGDSIEATLTTTDGDETLTWNYTGSR